VQHFVKQLFAVLCKAIEQEAAFWLMLAVMLPYCTMQLAAVVSVFGNNNHS
jgi:hypothetical protein